MIEENKTASKEIELAQKAMEQAKTRLARAKSKESEKLRKDTHKKFIIGGIFKKYFPDCKLFDETELNEMLSVALASEDCQKSIKKIKTQSAGYGTYQKPCRRKVAMKVKIEKVGRSFSPNLFGDAHTTVGGMCALRGVGVLQTAVASVPQTKGKMTFSLR